MTPGAADRLDAIEWAAMWAHRWFLDADGGDRLALPDGTSGGWAFHVESFEALVRIARARREGDVRRSAHPIAVLKRRGLDRQVRAWGLRALNLRLQAADGPRPVGIVGEIPTPSMLDPLIAVAKELQNHVTVGAADPRVYRRFAAAGLRPRALVVGLRKQRDVLQRNRIALRPLLEGFRREPPVMLLDGLDVGRQAMEALLPVAYRSLPWAGVERQAVQAFLASSGIRSVLLASDQHRVGRITTAAAREIGVRTVVAQHGLPRISVGLLPVVADRVAVWSEDAVAWFTQRGTDPKQVVITGNPRLDHARSGDRGATRQIVGGRFGINGSPNLLLALSPDAAEVNPALVRVALEALEQLPASRLLVKLHPGQGEWGWVSGQLKSSGVGDRARIARTQPLAPLLAWADLTLLHRSTVAVESLAHGTPIAVVSVAGTVSGADAELGELAPPVARMAHEVATIASEVTSEAGRVAYLAARSAPLERVVGALDGASSGRIASLLLEEAGIRAAT